MKMVEVQQAVGMVLGHDLTQIIPGKFKGVAFKKGHIIRVEDIPRLLDMGKQRIYVWEKKEGILHEDEAAERMARAAVGTGIVLTAPKEGKVSLIAKERGLLKINSDALFEINSMDEAMFATLHTDFIVEKDKLVGGTRIIPLVIEENKIREIEEICRIKGPIVQVRPFKKLKVGLITTGSEVYHGRIQDKFGPVIYKKVEEFGSEVIRQIFVSDSVEMIVNAIKELKEDGADLITVSGGMSVDPDDVTPAGIRASGGRIVSYGAPTLPGAMFMMAYIDENIPVLGLPGCVMYHERTIFDLILVKILAGEEIKKEDIIRLGHGGLCSLCDTCRFPNCNFGKW
jgi:molybdenum cofactor synthesis domain-containing protein